MPKSDPEFERGFTEGFNCQQKKIDAAHASAEKLRAALVGLMKAYGATDGRNGNSGECWDAARAVLAEMEVK